MSIRRGVRNVLAAPGRFKRAEDLPEGTNPDRRAEVIKSRQGMIARRLLGLLLVVLTGAVAVSAWLGDWRVVVASAVTPLALMVAVDWMLKSVKWSVVHLMWFAAGGAVVGSAVWFPLQFFGALAVAALLGTLVLAGWVVYAGWDGELANDLEPEEPKPGVLTEKAVCAAVAAQLKPRPADPVRAVVVEGPGLAWDERHVFQSVELAMRGYGFDDVNTVNVAKRLRLDPAWVVAEPVKGDGSMVRLHMAQSDPWDRDPTLPPWMSQPETDVWASYEHGCELISGKPVAFSLMQSSGLIGAGPGAGKTAWMRALGLLVASDPYAQLDLWDFKGDGALKMFEPVCETYGAGDEDWVIENFAAWLHDVAKPDLQRRKRTLSELPADVAPDSKVYREIARDLGVDLRARVVLIDEVQDAIGHPKLGTQIEEGIRYLVKQGRSAGWRVYVATQKPDRYSLPTSIRSVIPTRIALRCEDRASSEMVLGATVPDASKLPPVEGAAVIRGAGDGAALRGTVTLGFHYVSTANATAAMQRAVQNRATVGTLPGQDDPPPPAVVEDVAKVIRISGEPWMFSEDVARALGTTTRELGPALRTIGVESHPIRAERNRKAYFLSEVEQGLERARRRVSGVFSGSSPGTLRVVGHAAAGE